MTKPKLLVMMTFNKSGREEEMLSFNRLLPVFTPTPLTSVLTKPLQLTSLGRVAPRYLSEHRIYYSSSKVKVTEG